MSISSLDVYFDWPLLIWFIESLFRRLFFLDWISSQSSFLWDLIDIGPKSDRRWNRLILWKIWHIDYGSFCYVCSYVPNCLTNDSNKLKMQRFLSVTEDFGQEMSCPVLMIQRWAKMISAASLLFPAINHKWSRLLLGRLSERFINEQIGNSKIGFSLKGVLLSFVDIG